MKILIINTSDILGGAAQVAWTLAAGIRSLGHEVDMLVGKKSSDSTSVYELPIACKKPNKSIVYRVSHRFGINSLNFHSPFPRKLGSNFFKKYDIINIHDLPNFNWLHLPWLSAQAKLVWTFQCMQPFTGNCIYSYGCEKFCENHG